MIFINTNTVITFHYENEIVPNVAKGTHDYAKRNVVCNIKTVDPTTNKPSNTLATGKVGCHSSDIFVKEEGRKRALKKAILNLGNADKQTREAIWTAYHTRNNRKGFKKSTK